MDPLAHTLVGAALAETGLRHRTRYATATLLIGANLPDLDVVAQLWGNDTALHFRRGLTHGVLAMIVLPLLLTAALWLWHRWRGRAPAPGAAPPFRLRAIAALACLGVWSHPLLDWLNTYGVRLLMPFDGRWFYGDTLFIVDPWLWLLTAAGVVMARSRTRWARAGWWLLAALASGLVLFTDRVPAPARLIWCVALVLLIALRWRRPAWASAPGLARAGLAALLLYIGAAYGLARLAESTARTRFGMPLAQANPVPAQPLAHRLVLADPQQYRIVAADGRVHTLPRPPADAVVQAALAAPSVRGFANWLRFPYWTVEETPQYWRVHIQDLRYQGPDLPAATGIGAVQVEVPRPAPVPTAPPASPEQAR